MSQSGFDPRGPMGASAGHAAPGNVSRGMAVTALVLGIVAIPTTCVGVGALLGIVALILGVISLVQASREPDRYGGKGMAIGGMCTGGAALLLVPLVIAIMLPAVARARELARRTVAISSLSGIAKASYIYANDNGDAFPPDLNTLVSSGYASADDLISPWVTPNTTCDFHYVADLTTNDDVAWILAYSDPAYCNGEGGCILFVDGHVEFVREPMFSEKLEEFTAEFKADRGFRPEVIAPY